MSVERIAFVVSTVLLGFGCVLGATAIDPDRIVATTFFGPDDSILVVYETENGGVERLLLPDGYLSVTSMRVTHPETIGRTVVFPEAVEIRALAKTEHIGGSVSGRDLMRNASTIIELPGTRVVVIRFRCMQEFRGGLALDPGDRISEVSDLRPFCPAAPACGPSVFE